MDLPSGTVTFLLTDIEGSTRLWEDHPASMRADLTRHDEIAEAIIREFAGILVKSRGEGDSLFAVFPAAADAVAAAVALQTALARESWRLPVPLRVRMALHTGEAGLRDGDYYGPAVNRCARLRAIGHGGQVLLSASTTEIVRDSLPAEVSLRECGSHRLKDLGRPETVSQLLHPSLQTEFPPLRSLDNPVLPHNLPVQVSAFIGRVKELAAIRGLLSGSRLLTLTGSGGCGKTRLAIQTAAEMLDDWPGGAWLIELAAATDAAAVWPAAAEALALREQPGTPIRSSVLDHLRTKRLLLILDNCEHLLDSCAEFAESVLKGCPDVTILATSRECLGIAGEQTYRVPSMAVPDAEQPGSPVALMDFDAVRLFVERAALSQPDFRPSGQSARAVASICRRLDGIPLAIELAAARVRTLSAEEIENRLDQRFRLLTGGSRTALPRQQTLRSLIDWSYVLLNHQEQTLFRRLAVFSGGWTLEAAEAVCAGDGIEDWEIVDLLSSLIDKSLVNPLPGERVTRYRFLETVRQYARDRLFESPEAEACRDRHLAHFVELSERVAADLTSSRQVECLHQLDSEDENLSLAIEWSASLPETDESGLRIGAALSRYWTMRPRRMERFETLGSILARGPFTPSPTRATALQGHGMLAWNVGDYQTATIRAQEALGMFVALGDSRGAARALSSLGTLANSVGDPETAAAYYDRALPAFRQAGDLVGICAVLNNLGTVRMVQRDFRAAREVLEECLGVCRELGEPRSILPALVNLGEVEFRLGDLGAAKRYYRECLQASRTLGWLGNPFLTEGLAAVTASEGDLERSAVLHGAAERMREVAEMPSTPVEGEKVAKVVSALREGLGEDRFHIAWARGRAMSPEEAMEMAFGSDTA